MNDILREIGSISRMLDAIANIEFKELKLNKGQYIYLVRIFENEGIIPERLAEVIKVDPFNKKIKHLYTTEKGKHVVQFILRENEYSNKIATTQLSASEIETVSNLLSKIRESIESDWAIVKNGGKRDY